MAGRSFQTNSILILCIVVATNGNGPYVFEPLKRFTLFRARVESELDYDSKSRGATTGMV